MGRKAKNKAAKKIASAGKSNVAKPKKVKNLFKITDNKFNKKPKEIQSKLKKIKADVNNKREKIDANFKELHPSLVIKKSQGDQQQQLQKQKQSIKSKKKPMVSSKNVSETLEKCKI